MRWKDVNAWAFTALIIGLMVIVVGLTVFQSGSIVQIVLLAAAVLICILSGGLFAVGGGQPADHNKQHE